MKTYKYTVEINGIEFKLSVDARSESESLDKVWNLIRTRTTIQLDCVVLPEKQSFSSKVKNKIISIF